MTKPSAHLPRTVAVLTVAILSMTGCGGDEGIVESGQTLAGEPDAAAAPEETAAEMVPTEAAAPEAGGADLGEPPAPGEGLLVLEGQTYVGVIDHCDINQDLLAFGVIADADGQSVSFGASGHPRGAHQFGASIGDQHYSGSGGDVAVEDGSVRWVGEFTQVTDEGIVSAGRVRLAATCP